MKIEYLFKIAKFAWIIEFLSIIYAKITIFDGVIKYFDMDALEKFGIIPVNFSTLIDALGNYKYPKDKVSSLEKEGSLIRLKKGMFVVSPKIHHQTLSKELVANHLYGPSYISFESALSYYRLIPERVYSMRSMTIKRARGFSTPLGNFEYITARKEYYKIGINQKVKDKQYAFLIASPEKALCDLIVATPLLRIQSVKAMQTYMEEDLRIDLQEIENFDTEIIRLCINTGKKKTELTQLYKLLR